MAASTKHDDGLPQRLSAGRKYSRKEGEGNCRLFERSPFPLLLIDVPIEIDKARAAPRVVDANPAAVAFFEASGKAGLVWSLPRAFGPEELRVFEAAAVQADGEAGLSFETDIRTLRGSRRNAIIHCVRDTDPGHGIARIVVTIRDVTDLRMAEAVGEARLALLDYSLDHGLQDILQSSLDKAEELTESRIGFFHLVDEDGRTLVLQNWSTRTKEVFRKAAGKGLHYDIDQAGVWVECVRTGRPTIHNDYATMRGKKGLPQGHAPVLRELVVPVLRGGKVAAILGVGNKECPYDERDASVLSKLADFAWEIAERKRVEESLRCLATCFSAKTGRDSFDSASRRLSEELRVSDVILASWSRGSSTLRILGDSLGSRSAALSAIPLAHDEAPGAPSVESVRETLERWIRDRENSETTTGFSNTLVLGEDGARVLLAGLVDAILGLYKDRLLAEAARTEAACKAIRTVRALKTYAHEAPSDLFEEISVEESIRSTLELYYVPENGIADIALSCEPTPPVLAQPDRLAQVWVNLISNAIHAASGKAKIDIPVRRDGGISCKRAPGRTVFTVSLPLARGGMS